MKRFANEVLSIGVRILTLVKAPESRSQSLQTGSILLWTRQPPIR